MQLLCDLCYLSAIEEYAIITDLGFFVHIAQFLLLSKYYCNIMIIRYMYIMSWDVTKFAFEFDYVRTSKVFSRFKIHRIFSHPVVKFESQSTYNVCCRQLNMLKVIEFLNLGFIQRSFHYEKNVSIIGITFLHFI